MNLRKWQQDNIDKFVQDRMPHNWLIHATPGSGKTVGALAQFSLVRDQGLVSRLVVIAPSINIRDGWVEAAAKQDIQLVPNGSNWNQRLDGRACSYQSLLGNYYHQLLREARDEPTMFVLDEVHHAAVDGTNGSGNVWGLFGNQLVAGDQHYRLGLTGTPWREQGTGVLPFVRYLPKDGAQVAIPNFAYPYYEAIRDGVCRPALFTPINFDASPERGGTGAVIRQSDAPNEREAARLLAAAYEWRGSAKWLRAIIAKADEELTQVRELYPEAGALLIARDIEMADACGRLIQEVTRHRASVITSKDPQAHEELERFASSGERWAVAVSMISEGVDIPRLMVGVFATDEMTDLRVRQIVGRFVRKTEGDMGQSARIFIPADIRLARIVADIEKDVAIGHDLVVERQSEQRPESSATATEQSTFYKVLEAFADSPTYRGEDVGSLANEAQAACRTYGLPEAFWPQMAAYMRDNGARTALLKPPAARPLAVVPAKSAVQRNQELRAEVKRAANALARELDIEYIEMNRRIAERHGRREDLSNDDLEFLLEELQYPEEWRR